MNTGRLSILEKLRQRHPVPVKLLVKWISSGRAPWGTSYLGVYRALISHALDQGVSGGLDRRP
jgi:hypothetical protein